MNGNAARPWDQRRFAAAGAAMTGLALPATGLADHFAAQSGDPASWSIVHTSLGILFVVFATWHCALNRRTLLRYLRDGLTPRTLPGRDVLVAGGHRGRPADADAHARHRRPMSRREGRKHRDHTPHVRLDRSRCDACWRCVETCPRSVMGKVDVLGHRHARIRAPDACGGCGRCVKVCPSGALAAIVTQSSPPGEVLPPPAG
jgi:NAD-dependent dihydropyrimidine dehydrogenase PreA subunit